MSLREYLPRTTEGDDPYLPCPQTGPSEQDVSTVNAVNIAIQDYLKALNSWPPYSTVSSPNSQIFTNKDHKTATKFKLLPEYWQSLSYTEALLWLEKLSEKTKQAKAACDQIHEQILRSQQRETANIQQIISLSHSGLMQVIKWIPGESLTCATRNTQKLDNILKDPQPITSLLNLLVEMQTLGYIHTDLKPDNIIVEKANNITLIDTDMVTKSSDTPTTEGLLGTPGFIPPYAAGLNGVTYYNSHPSRDYYALAMTIGHMLASKFGKNNWDKFLDNGQAVSHNGIECANKISNWHKIRAFTRSKSTNTESILRKIRELDSNMDLKNGIYRLWEIMMHILREGENVKMTHGLIDQFAIATPNLSEI